MPKRICVCGRDDAAKNKDPVVIRITTGCNQMHACVDGQQCLNGSNSNICVTKLRDSKSKNSSSNKLDTSPTKPGTDDADVIPQNEDAKNDDKSKKKKDKKNKKDKKEKESKKDKKSKKKETSKEQNVYYMKDNTTEEKLPNIYSQYYKKFPEVSFTDPDSKVLRKKILDSTNTIGEFPKVEFESPDEILRLGARPSQKLITYGPTSFREPSRSKHFVSNDCMLPVVPARYHGNGCAIEISVLEKHDPNCRYAKKPNPKRYSVDDRPGSYEVIGRIAYQTCNGNKDVGKTKNISEVLSFISETLSADNKNNNFTIFPNKHVTKTDDRRSLTIQRSRSYSGPSTSKNISFDNVEDTETVRTVIIGVITSNKSIQMTPRESRLRNAARQHNHENTKWYLHIFSCFSSGEDRNNCEAYYTSSSRITELRELMVI